MEVPQMTDVQKTNDTDRDFADIVRLGTASSRRGLLAGAGALSASALLAACGTETTDTPGAGTTTEDIGAQPAGSANPPAGEPSKSSGGSSAEAIATADEVPVGGGVIKDKLVVTQPKKGEFKAFTKICTHQNCPVTEVKGGTINCKCHQSKFSIEDGSVKGGPAPSPLKETEVKLDGDNIVEA
jgi:Rieske Fe-S protein